MALSTYDSTGLQAANYAQILEHQVAEAEDTFGKSINTDQKGLLGHLLRQHGLGIAEVNEIVQQMYDAISVSNAQGVYLDNLLELLHITRASAAKSTVTLTCTATKACTIPAGSKVKTSAGVFFETDTDLVFTTAGSSDVAATCTEYGPINVSAAELTTIATAVNGWSTVTNSAAATPGRDRELDAELKARHTIAVSTSGDRDLASMYEALTALTGVSSVLIVDVPTDTNPISVYIIGGSSTAIATAIDGNLTAGIGTAGSTEVSLYNETLRQPKTIRYTVGEDLTCYVSATVTVSASLAPDDWEDQVKDNLVDIFDAFELGDPVPFFSLGAAFFAVPGVVPNAIYLGTSPSPSGTADLTVNNNQRASLVTTNVVITQS